MRRPSIFHVKKCTLLAIAGCVWILAGCNVARLGILSYEKSISVNVIHILGSILIFLRFGLMFYEISKKNRTRIMGYQGVFCPVWQFFELKAYCIMAVMIGGGIWLRSSGLLPDLFIAILYTGIGCALALAGILFWFMYFQVKEEM